MIASLMRLNLLFERMVQILFSKSEKEWRKEIFKSINDYSNVSNCFIRDSLKPEALDTFSLPLWICHFFSTGYIFGYVERTHP